MQLGDQHNNPLRPRPPPRWDERTMGLSTLTDLTPPDILATVFEYLQKFGDERGRRYGMILYGLAERKFNLEISQGVDRIIQALFPEQSISPPPPQSISSQAVLIEMYFHHLNMKYGLDWFSRVSVDTLVDFMVRINGTVNLESRSVPHVARLATPFPNSRFFHC